MPIGIEFSVIVGTTKYLSRFKKHTRNKQDIFYFYLKIPDCHIYIVISNSIYLFV